ncbi:MAG: cytochrome b6f complex subunit PetL [Cyanobacteria bacterium]|nr:cytochrome b6f complex subunit PetL [Cyanobacteria bacterium CG_2015-16_32_12]NCO76872.1 cytochrome b6f complex subunit PetL [Cyanobacteria bacterium CG_2015-22_32_23]NCQ03325.1 cytochrome b6f complex subunit PetL [Cyanobacteria bacterium CG_2015-09_32_10]NCQ43120.1 cytochrome b6f complex subunit PetL [Cyanobacteria bacterium CG_2015-04_32_10]NCS84364.1 cytochrome b6f complex subunit PetL [Cyanobacteria bacterium CG_2015-02_32_10]
MSSIIAYLGIIVTFSAIALTLFYGLRAIKFL